MPDMACGEMIQADTPRADLIAEIKRLRAENARLKNDVGLLEWMTHHHLPLQLFVEAETGAWVVVDGSTDCVMGSGEDAESALVAARAALTEPPGGAR